MANLTSLRSFSELDKDEKTVWFNRFPSTVDMKPDRLEKLYRNQMFIDKFGLEAFASLPNFDDREYLFRASVIRPAFEEMYKDRAQDFGTEHSLINLSLNAQQYLLENPYETRQEREESAQKFHDDLELMRNQPFGKWGSSLAESVRKHFDDKGDENILSKAEKIAKEEYESKPRVVQTMDAIKNNLYGKKAQDESFVDVIHETFRDIMNQTYPDGTPMFPTYKAYEDSYQVTKGITIDDEIDAISKYYALSNELQYEQDENVRNELFFNNIQTIDMDSRHKIYEETKFYDKYQKAKRQVFAYAASDIGSTALGIEALYLKLTDEQAYQNFILGKDKDGNQLPWYNSIAYYSGVGQFNMYDPDEVMNLMEKGGVSKEALLKDVGEEYAWFTPETFLEGSAQVGYTVGGLALDYCLTAGGGAAIKATTKGFIKTGLKFGTKTAVLANRARRLERGLDFALDMTRIGLGATGEATLEAYGSTQEFTAEATAKMAEKINSETKEYAKDLINSGIDPESQMYSDAIENFKQLREDYYTEDLKKQAGEVFAMQATAMALKNSAIDVTTQTYKFAKPFSYKTNGAISKEFFKDGKLREFNWKTGIKTAAKTAAGGFIEEASDSFTGEGAIAVGMYNFNNTLLNSKYNGEAAQDTASIATLAGEYFGGMMDAAFEESTWAEAATALMSNASVNINVGGIASLASKSGRQAFKQGTTAEKINTFLLNPIAAEVINKKREYEQTARDVEHINSVIQENASEFSDVNSTISVLNDFYNARETDSDMQAHDAKFNLGFQTVVNLSSKAKLRDVSPSYQNELNSLEEAAKGNVSDMEVQQYLNMPENKSLQGTEDGTPEKAREQIQHNAKKLLSLMDQYVKAKDFVDKSTSEYFDEDAKNQLVYNMMLEQDFDERLSGIEKGLNGSTKTNIVDSDGQLNQYGAKKLYQEYKQNAELLTEQSKNYTSKAAKKNAKRIIDKYNDLAQHYLNISKQLESENKDASGSVVSADELIRMSPEARQRVFNNPNFYTKEQRDEISKAETTLIQKNTKYKEAINDSALLQNRINEVRESFKSIMTNPEAFVAYRDSVVNNALIQRLNAVEKQKLNEIVSELDKIPLANNNEIQAKVKEFNTRTLEDIISLRPELKTTITPILGRAKTLDKLSSVIDKLDVSKEQKSALKQSVAVITDNALTEQEIVDAIEDFISKTGNNTEGELVLREQLDEVLSRAKDVDIIRNATKVEERGDSLSKDRKAFEKKQERERKKAERKEAAKKKAEEKEKLKQEAEAKKKAESMNGKIEDTSANLGSNLKVEEEEEIAGFEYSKDTEQVLTKDETDKDTPTTIEPETVTVSQQSDLENLPATSYVSEATQLRGNTLTPYNTNELEEKKLVLKEDAKDDNATGWRADFYRWMRNAGIDFQSIIDFELADIAKSNPVVHYMMVKPEYNVTNDAVLVETPLLVVEATPSIKKIHKEDRGGIIRANGKDWLVIGMMGYADQSQNEQVLWQKTLNKLSTNRDVYFKQNPTERFEVDDKYTTSIKDIAIGRLIKQLESDTNVEEHRTISELLADPKRNPYGLTWKDLAFAIQMKSGNFELSRDVDGTVYAPKRIEENAGNLFLMVKASNGGYVPATIRPTVLSEIRPGSLKDTIDVLLQQVLNSDHKVRHEAISQLKFLINLTDDDNILIGKDGFNVVTIKQNGTEVDRFNLDSQDFNKAEAFEKLKNTTFRIQITRNDLKDIKRLQQLDEAGCLTTDLALLGTAGSHYTILATNLDTGKPIMQEPTSDSTVNSVVRGSELSASKEPKQFVGGKAYRYHNGNWTDEAGNIVTNSETLQKIKVANYIEEHDLPIAYKTKGYDVYIISDNKDNPRVAMINKSRDILLYKGQEAINAINYYENKNRSKAANTVEMEDINLGLTETINSKPSKTDNTNKTVTKKETTSKQKTKKNETFSEVKREKSLEDLQNSNILLTFADVVKRNREIGKHVMTSITAIFKEKGWDILPISQMDEFFKSKDISLPTSLDLDSVNRWLEMIKNCK